MKCKGCDQPAVWGALCKSCASGLATAKALVLGQITSSQDPGEDRETLSSLIDQWGRVHSVGASCVIGREIEGSGVAILHGSVSRKHAHITRDRHTGQHWITDLHSTNGTFVAGTQLKPGGGVSLADGETLHAGHVSFLFTKGQVPGVRGTAPMHAAKTFDPDSIAAAAALIGGDPSAQTMDSAPSRSFADLEDLNLRIDEASGGGGYVCTTRGSVALSSIQMALFRTLADRMLAEAAQPESIRGFASSPSLLAELPWDCRVPQEDHLKNLVRRVRRHFVSAGVGNLIESRRGLGYRLKVIPRPL